MRRGARAALFLCLLVAAVSVLGVGRTDRHTSAFLPVVHRNQNAFLCVTPTLGPSPTPTRTCSPVPTRALAFDVQKAVWPQMGGVGSSFLFTIGLANRSNGSVQATLVDDLPGALRMVRLWPPDGAQTSTTDSGFAMTLTVSPGQSINVFFLAVVEEIPCSGGCYVQNQVVWAGLSAEGRSEGVAWSPPILLLDVTPTQIITPTPQPTATATPRPTLGPSPTPTPEAGG